MSDSARYFVRAPEEYVRTYDIFDVFVKSNAKALSCATGKPFGTCLDYVKVQTGQGGKYEYKDTPMNYVGRKANADREVRQTTFLAYLKTVKSHKLIMSPTMTVYQNPKVKRSITSTYIAKNVKLRSKYKKEKFVAQESRKADKVILMDNRQQNQKIKNNALSGAHVSDSTPLVLPTIHSSLTSTCRSATGYGNSNNEKLVMGNRHYWSMDIVVANIGTILVKVDAEPFDAMIKQYGLVYPTVEQTMECIEYSGKLYGLNESDYNIIQRVVSGMSDVERAIFVYVGDLYHIRKYNDQFTRDFLDALSEIGSEPVEDPRAELKLIPEEAHELVSLLCGKYMNGYSIGSWDDLTDEAKVHIGATARHIRNGLDHYRTFIKEVFVTDIMPASMANLPSIIRRCAVTSDTDSTIYTVQDWVAWYNRGEATFAEKPSNVGHAVSFIAASSIVHILALMSANIGIVTEQIHQYAMKAEYFFPVFVLTSRTKTYFANMAAQEGQVFTKTKTELKGAVLKGSNSPEFVIDESKALIEHILETAYADKKIKLYPILERIAKIEKRIFDSIHRGDPDFYKRNEIKPADSYKNEPHLSPHVHYLAWEEIMANKYGHAPELPYPTLKVSIDVKNKTDFKNWLDRIADPAIVENIKAFCLKYNKPLITTFQVPKVIVDESGIPPELIAGIASRKTVSNLCEPLYVILETLGYYSIDDNQSRLVSDNYLPEVV